MSRPLAITCGDPAGVGPEIIAAWLMANPKLAAETVVIGPQRWLESLNTRAQKLAVGLEEFVATPGEPNADGALVAWAAMERAAAGCREGAFSGVVSGPVSKERLARIGYPFPGQTEFFAAGSCGSYWRHGMCRCTRWRGCWDRICCDARYWRRGIWLSRRRGFPAHRSLRSESTRGRRWIIGA